MSLTISKPRKLRQPIRIENLGGVRIIKSPIGDTFSIDELFYSVSIDESNLKINCGFYVEYE